MLKAVFLRKTSAGAPRLLLRIGTQQQTAGLSVAAVYSVLSHTGGFFRPLVFAYFIISKTRLKASTGKSFVWLPVGAVSAKIEHSPVFSI